MICEKSGSAIGTAAGPLATTANDAGLVAQTLQAAGFDVVGARDLDADGIRKAFRDFLETLAYPCEDETDNPVYRLFLR